MTTDTANEVSAEQYNSEAYLASLSPIEARALELLGDGHPQGVVASTLGVSPGRITQYLANEHFSAEVSKLKYVALQSHTNADKKVDRIADKILDKIEKNLPLMHKTGELIKAFQILNSAKRRGAPTDGTSTLINATIVNLTLPAAIVNKYKTDSQSQVIEVNDKPFLTAPSHMLPALSAEAINTAQVEQIERVNNAAETIREVFTDAEARRELSKPVRVKGQTVSAEDL